MKIQIPEQMSLHLNVFKEFIGSICTPLAILFKATVEQKKLTKSMVDCYRHCNIQQGSRKDPSNCSYQPVGLTCISCKIIDLIFRDQIITRMKENELLSNSQFSLIGGYITALQLLNVQFYIDNFSPLDQVYTLQKIFRTKFLLQTSFNFPLPH